jgi:hypothetical protein
MRNVSDESSRENQNTQLMLHNIFQKIATYVRCVERYGRAERCNMMYALCMLDDYDYKHTHNM